MEIFEESIRRKSCPGKARNKKESYLEAWEMTVKYFGSGNVAISCIFGFGEDYNKVLKHIEEYAQLGVGTVLVFTQSQ